MWVYCSKRVPAHIPIGIDPTPQPNRIALNIPPDRGVVIAEVVVVRSSLIVPSPWAMLRSVTVLRPCILDQRLDEVLHGSSFHVIGPYTAQQVSKFWIPQCQVPNLIDHQATAKQYLQRSRGQVITHASSGFCASISATLLAPGSDLWNTDDPLPSRPKRFGPQWGCHCREQ